MKYLILLVVLAACSDNPHRQYDVPVNFVDTVPVGDSIERISNRKGVHDPGIVQYVTYTNITQKRFKIIN